MANIKELIQSIESPDSSFDEKLAVINEMQDTLVAMKEHEQEAIDDNVELIIEALRTIEAKVEAKLRIIPEKGEQGIQGQKGEQGDRGLDGAQGKNGKSGVDGKDGLDGKDGVSVQDAKIDFDGSLVITLSDGREINVGEVVPVDVAQTIHKIQSGSGGDSQTTLNAIAALQATIATYGTMATQNANAVAITGGTINNTTIGATTPSTGVFTTLTGNSTSQFGRGSANYLQAVGGATTVSPVFSAQGTDTNIDLNLTPKGTGQVKATNTTNMIVQSIGQSGFGSFLASSSTGSAYLFGYSGGSEVGRIYFSSANSVGIATSSAATQQFAVSHTASAVNYVQVTGAATGSSPTISSQGSDASPDLTYNAKGAGRHFFQSGGSFTFQINPGAGQINRLRVQSSPTGFGPILDAVGSDTDIPLVLSPKGTGALQAQQTDSTATGGNARGANAVDWQTNRDTAAKVASGLYSVISGGSRNQSSGDYSTTGGGYNNSNQAYMGVISGGQNNTNQGTYAAIVGGQSNSAQGIYTFIGGGWTNTGTAQSAVTTQSATMNATTTVTLAASNASIKVGQYISGTYISGQTYVAAISGTTLTLSQAASGSGTSTLSFNTPHGVVVGGGNNQATGAYSFIGGGGDAGTAANRNVASGDWSTVCGGWRNTASGQGAFVGGGGNNSGSPYANLASGTSSAIVAGVGGTASGANSFLGGGYGNLTNGDSSAILGGVLGTTRGIVGNQVAPACNNPIGTAGLGVSQSGLLILGRQTTDATATVLTSNTSAAGTNNQVILPNNSAYAFRGEIVSGVTGGGNSKSWTIEGLIKRGANAAATTLVGSTVTSMYADAGAVTWTIALSADTTNGGLAVTFTGQAATTIRTVCRLNTTEMTY